MNEHLPREELIALVDVHVSQCAEPTLQQIMLRGIVEPRLELRGWDYGEPGQRFPCWIVWEHRDSGTCVGYCLQGFGPSQPWGLLRTDPKSSLGMDSQWYEEMSAAIRESFAWDFDKAPKPKDGSGDA